MDADQIRKLLKRVAIAGAFFLVAFLFYKLEWRSVLIGYAILVTVVMILSILLQSGRGGGLASMGGMGGNNLLGARAATPIAKATYIMGALFLFICMLIARLDTLEAAGTKVIKPEQAPKTQETQETKQTTPETPDDQTSTSSETSGDKTQNGGSNESTDTPSPGKSSEGDEQ